MNLPTSEHLYYLDCLSGAKADAYRLLSDEACIWLCLQRPSCWLPARSPTTIAQSCLASGIFEGRCYYKLVHIVRVLVTPLGECLTNAHMNATAISKVLRAHAPESDYDRIFGHDLTLRNPWQSDDALNNDFSIFENVTIVAESFDCSIGPLDTLFPDSLENYGPRFTWVQSLIDLDRYAPVRKIFLYAQCVLPNRWVPDWPTHLGLRPPGKLGQEASSIVHDPDFGERASRDAEALEHACAQAHASATRLGHQWDRCYKPSDAESASSSLPLRLALEDAWKAGRATDMHIVEPLMEESECRFYATEMTERSKWAWTWDSRCIWAEVCTSCEAQGCPQCHFAKPLGLGQLPGYKSDLDFFVPFSVSDGLGLCGVPRIVCSSLEGISAQCLPRIEPV